MRSTWFGIGLFRNDAELGCREAPRQSSRWVAGSGRPAAVFVPNGLRPDLHALAKRRVIEDSRVSTGRIGPVRQPQKWLGALNSIKIGPE